MSIDPASPPLGLAEHNPVIQSLVEEVQRKPDNRPSVRVCENGACHLPVFGLDEVRKMVLNA
jgi:NADH:ubiquinone oxidoreductase subunit E